MKIKKLLTLSWLLLLVASGCTSKIVNPYESSYQCPDPKGGKCVDLPGAYQQATEQEPVSPVLSTLKTNDSIDIAQQYKESLYGELKQLIDNPETPVVVPPQVIRILFLPYTSQENNTFLGYRYIYFVADKPTWTISSSNGIAP